MSKDFTNKSLPYVYTAVVIVLEKYWKDVKVTAWKEATQKFEESILRIIKILYR